MGQLSGNTVEILQTLQPGGIEAVEAAELRVGVRQMKRQRPQVAVRRQELGQAAHLRRGNRTRWKPGWRWSSAATWSTPSSGSSEQTP